MVPVPLDLGFVKQSFASTYSVIIEHHASLLCSLCNRGIIVFENKSYVLEPLEGATSEHKIYQAENLKITPGSCGHQLDISAMGADGNDTSRHSQAGRVGG